MGSPAATEKSLQARLEDAQDALRTLKKQLIDNKKELGRANVKVDLCAAALEKATRERDAQLAKVDEIDAHVKAAEQAVQALANPATPGQ